MLPLLILTILEDLHIDTPPKYRLLLTIVSAVSIYYFMPKEFAEKLNEVGIHYTSLIAITLVIIITILMIQATNLIDGANGIVLLNSIMVLLVIYSLANQFDDSTIIELSALSLIVIIAFLPWNYPYAKLFCGDTGAYIIGAFLSYLTALLYFSHEKVSLALLFSVFSYPLYEISFTILRRFWAKKSLFSADHQHLHHLLFRRFKSDRSNWKSNQINNLLAPVILAIQIPAMSVSTFFPENFILLSGLFISTYAGYSTLYIFLRLKEKRCD